MSLAEAESQLTTVNSAIEQLLSGKRINQLRVGSGSFQRLYVYSETTLQDLVAYRNELLGIIDALSDSTPTFRTNAHIPLVVSKEIY